jgi:hypothetical protein
MQTAALRLIIENGNHEKSLPLADYGERFSNWTVN